MNTDKYKTFLSVIETGNMTKTAELLGYSQPAVSHMISSLEKEYGFSLLFRGTDRLTPTNSAKTLIPFFRDIVYKEMMIEDTVNNINNILSGTIHIGSIHSLLMDFVPTVIHEFSTQYPRITLYIEEFIPALIRDAFMENSIDIAFMDADSVPAGFDFIPLFKDEILVVMHKNHPLASKQSITYADFSHCKFLMPLDSYADHLAHIINHPEFNPHVYCHVGSDDAFLNMISRGDGVAILPSAIIGEKVFPIKTLSLPDRQFRSLGIALRSENLTTPNIKKMVALAGKIASEKHSKWLLP